MTLSRITSRTFEWTSSSLPLLASDLPGSLHLANCHDGFWCMVHRLGKDSLGSLDMPDGELQKAQDVPD